MRTRLFGAPWLGMAGPARSIVPQRMHSSPVTALRAYGLANIWLNSFSAPQPWLLLRLPLHRLLLRLPPARKFKRNPHVDAPQMRRSGSALGSSSDHPSPIRTKWPPLRRPGGLPLPCTCHHPGFACPPPGRLPSSGVRISTGAYLNTRRASRDSSSFSSHRRRGPPRTPRTLRTRGGRPRRRRRRPGRPSCPGRR